MQESAINTRESPVKISLPNKEVYSVGANTREWIVGDSICESLVEKNIWAAGVTDAAQGYNFMRAGWEGSVLLACVAGYGEVLVDNKWTPCREGSVYLAPALAPHAYRAIRGSRWKLCWVLFRENQNVTQALPLAAPLLVKTNPRPLESAIWGLYEELHGANEPGVIHRWVDLIHLLALRMVHPLYDEVLWSLWKAVESDLAHPWTESELARRSGMSCESLRLLCHKWTGRSAMKHVTFLRMQRAAYLLSTTKQKVYELALSLGYKSEFAFSNAFKRCIGLSPFDYRKRKR